MYTAAEHLQVSGHPEVSKLNLSSCQRLAMPSHSHAKDQEEPGATDDRLQDVDLRVGHPASGLSCGDDQIRSSKMCQANSKF